MEDTFIVIYSKKYSKNELLKLYKLYSVFLNLLSHLIISPTVRYFRMVGDYFFLKIDDYFSNALTIVLYLLKWKISNCSMNFIILVLVRILFGDVLLKVDHYRCRELFFKGDDLLKDFF